MMMPLKDILAKYQLVPSGVIHVGAHWAEEHDEYVACGIKKFIYIEPCLDAYSVLLKRFADDPDVLIFKHACADKETRAVMYVSHDNEGQSNSLLEPGLHLEQHPNVVFNDAEIVDVVLLDNIYFNREDYDMLVMDVQGAEGLVLKGATETLKHIDIIYTEVNRGETYKGNMLIDEMDKFLNDFEIKETYWPSPNWTWGDCLITRKNN